MELAEEIPLSGVVAISADDLGIYYNDLPFCFYTYLILKNLVGDQFQLSYF